MKNPADIVTWLIALIITARMTWNVHQHDLPLLTTVTIALCVLYAVKAGADSIVRGINAARQNGATR